MLNASILISLSLLIAWHVDGKASADAHPGVGIPKTFGEVVAKIVGLTNKQKQEKGIFGDDIAIAVDDGLAGIEIEYVLLKRDTVWNMLKKLAVFGRAYVHEDRCGRIRITKAGNSTGESGVEITPDNSFSYNLPDWDKTVINRVIVEYTEVAAGEAKDDEFKVELDKCEKVIENGREYYVATMDLKNFHRKVEKSMIKRYEDEEYRNEWIPKLEFEIAN